MRGDGDGRPFGIVFNSVLKEHSKNRLFTDYLPTCEDREPLRAQRAVMRRSRTKPHGTSVVVALLLVTVIHHSCIQVAVYVERKKLTKTCNKTSKPTNGLLTWSWTHSSAPVNRTKKKKIMPDRQRAKQLCWINPDHRAGKLWGTTRENLSGKTDRKRGVRAKTSRTVWDYMVTLARENENGDCLLRPAKT